MGQTRGVRDQCHLQLLYHNREIVGKHIKQAFEIHGQ